MDVATVKTAFDEDRTTRKQVNDQYTRQKLEKLSKEELIDLVDRKVVQSKGRRKAITGLNRAVQTRNEQIEELQFTVESALNVLNANVVAIDRLTHEIAALKKRVR